MFSGCYKIINIDLSSFQDTKNVNNMSYMFYGCKSLVSLPDISKWDTKNVNDMSYMFYGCNFLKFLGIFLVTQPSNIHLILVTFLVSHLEIPSKLFNELQRRNILNI